MVLSRIDWQPLLSRTLLQWIWWDAQCFSWWIMSVCNKKSLVNDRCGESGGQPQWCWSTVTLGPIWNGKVRPPLPGEWAYVKMNFLGKFGRYGKYQITMWGYFERVSNSVMILVLFFYKHRVLCPSVRFLESFSNIFYVWIVKFLFCFIK